MDILQPVPVDQWCFLRDSLKRDWPTYAYYYYFVNNAIKWKKKEPEYNLHIFCPHGDVNAGTFLGIARSANIEALFGFSVSFNSNEYFINRGICCTCLRSSSRKTYCVEFSYIETKVIDWTEPNFFPAVHSHFIMVLEDFVKDHGDEKHIALQDKGKMVPEECELRRLNDSHIPFVHSLWLHRSKEQPEKTTEFFAAMVRLNRGIGLFLKKDGSLVSWAIHFNWGGLGMLQTVEEHKQKGYARVVSKALVKALAEEENLDSFAFIEVQNAPSLKLFESLGYKRLGSAAYYHIQPKSKCD